jgi:LytR cell envelope-related transcriptional attenuator
VRRIETAERAASRAEPLPRILAAAALATLLAVVAVALADPGLTGGHRPAVQGPTLIPPSHVTVDVLNGSGDATRTRLIAARIGSLAYHVTHVRRADRLDYPETTVFYQPGGRAIAARLAAELEVAAKPLPGGREPRRLTVVVGD